MKNMKPISETPPILNLPLAILYVIFSLLPTKSILSCKSVCKLWCSIIRNPDFSGSSKSISLIVRRDGDNRSNKNLHLVDPEIDYAVRKRNGNLCLVLGNNSVTRFNDGGFDGYHIKTLKIVNSCKGLVSFSGTSNEDGQWEPFFVCNPFTSDYVVIKHPRSTELGHCVQRHAGFGFSSRSDKYKLLRFFYRKKTDHGFGDIDESLVAEVYTLGSDEQWRILDNHPPQGNYWSGKGIFLEGSLHWLVIDMSNAGRIVAFDCQEEIFVLMDLPNGLTHDSVKTFKTKMTLAILQSQLCFCMWGKERKDCEIWIMDEYGVEESWRKHFVVSTGESPSHLMPYKPLVYLTNGEILMLSEAGVLVSYDVTSNRWRAVIVPGVTARVEAMLLDPIFRPTKNLLMQGGITQDNN